ncbi:hypothetical protein PFISCL1PPCAC_22835, partial [Pristionchus fissidentatus]
AVDCVDRLSTSGIGGSVQSSPIAAPSLQVDALSEHLEKTLERLVTMTVGEHLRVRVLVGFGVDHAELAVYRTLLVLENENNLLNLGIGNRRESSIEIAETGKSLNDGLHREVLAAGRDRNAHAPRTLKGPQNRSAQFVIVY